MANYYFTYWMLEHGKEKFVDITNKVFQKAVVPEELKNLKDVNKDEFLFHYFFIVYYVVTLFYFGVDEKQISMCLDIVVAPGLSSIFKPRDILDQQKDNILELTTYIQEDFKKHYN